jgi:peroxiredoxin
VEAELAAIKISFGIIQPFNRPILMMIRTFLSLFLFIFAALASAPTKPLEEGDPIPDVVLRSDTDQELPLRKLVSVKPAVLIFYRGGWCPFCTRHLAELAAIEKDLLAAGVQLLAISMDQPSKLRQVPNRDQLGYRLLSDQDATAAKAFGIAFQVDDATVKRYKDSFNIDLEAASGRTHHTLPHPAVYIVDTSGVIHFAHVNPDYKVRLEPAKILDAARKVTR